MNKVILIGRLTNDPELRYTNTGKAVCSLYLAVQKQSTITDDSSADFIPIVC